MCLGSLLSSKKLLNWSYLAWVSAEKKKPNKMFSVSWLVSYFSLPRELGEIRTLKTLQVFGIVTDSSLQLLEEALPDMKINGSHFTSIARPTVGTKKSHEIWGIKCRLTLRNPSFLWSCTMHRVPWTHSALKLLRKKSAGAPFIIVLLLSNLVSHLNVVS